MNEDREFDLIVYGATGFTGRLVAEYLSDRSATARASRWAMAGRSAEKLAAVRDEIGAPADTPLVVADVEEPASLAAMARRTRAILSTVGPYTWYGTPLVEACVEAGTDCLDLAGEVLWMRDMIDRFGARAAETGARIVHSAGFDSIPFDHGVLHLQREAEKRFGSPCRRVRGRVIDMRGTLSGGTAASARATAETIRADERRMAQLMDPFCLAGGFQGPPQPDGQSVAEDPVSGGWVAPFFMAPINTKNVHRTNALLGHPYGEDFEYDEMFFAGPGEAGEKMAAVFLQMSEAMSGGGEGERGGGGSGPKPGEGPSKAEREAGGYAALFIGTHAKGGEIRTKVTGDRDPGYGSTSKILAEAGLYLLEERDETPGGIWTPAAALGEGLIPRLVEHAGLTFDVVDVTGA